MMLGNLAAMLIVLIIVSIAVWKGLDIYTRHGESIAVPDVKGSLVGDARYVLTQARLKAVVVDSAYNRQLPAGTVIDQTPHGGNEVKSGREVYLVVNAANPRMLAMPDIADNSSLREAQAKLRALGFKLGPVEYVPGDKEWVYGVKSRGRNVYAGERVPVDVPLILQVGNTSYEEQEFDVFEEMEEEAEDNLLGGDDAEDIDIITAE